MEPLAGERYKNESSRAVQACNDYLRMGNGRSLAALWRHYLETPQNTQPTQSYNTIRRWSERYGWPGRADAFDAELERQKNERAAEILQSGLALVHERVDVLNKVALFLLDQVYQQDEDGNFPRVWLPDVKQIGGGEFAEKVDIERFNAGIFDQLRGALDDLAKETGGRIHKGQIDVTSGGESVGTVFEDALARVYGVAEHGDSSDGGGVDPEGASPAGDDPDAGGSN